MLLSPNADELAQLAIDEKIEVVTTGAGNPAKYIPAWKEAGVKGDSGCGIGSAGKAYGAFWRRCCDR